MRGSVKPEHVFVLALTAIFLVVFSGQFALLFTSDGHRLSKLSGKLPYWDFANLWAGASLALHGHVATIFDVESYRAWLRGQFNSHLPDQEWSYPPSLLLVGLPFAILPIGIAYFCWQGLSFLALFVASRFLSLSLPGRIALTLSPASLMSALLGQNGLFSSALLISSLSLLSRRPVLAGALMGLLTMKPQLGILLPFCLLASRNYAAIGSAAATTFLLFLLTGTVFGFDVWTEFWTKTRPLMAEIMNAPFPNDYQVHMVTVFASLRTLGVSVVEAQAAQIVVAIGCVFVCWRIWRAGATIDPIDRVCLTIVLVLLATPYAYDYDSTPVCAACLYILLYKKNVPVLFPALGFAAPLLLYYVRKIDLFVDPIVPLAIVAYFLIEARHGALHVGEGRQTSIRIGIGP